MPCSVSYCAIPRIVKSGCSTWLLVLHAVVLSSLITSPRASCTQAERDTITRLEQDAQSALTSQKPELAILDYQKILAHEPANARAHSNLGLAYYLHGDFALAAGEFNIALRSQSGQWNIIALCGLSEANIGHNVEAVAHLDTAFQHIEDPELRLAVGKRLFSLLFEKGDLDRAAEIVSALERLEPNNIDVLYAAHQTYSGLESKIFVTMAQLAPDSARMYQMRGDRMARMGKINAAIAAYRHAIERDSYLPGVHFELAELLSVSTVSSDRDQAEGEYRKELAIHPQDEKSECRLGDIYMQRSDLKAAIEHYQRALQLQPGDADANEGYGMALLTSDLPSQARTYLERAIQLDPTNVIALYHLSQAYREMGDIDMAKSKMNEFLKRKAEREKLTHTFDDLPILSVTDTPKQDN